jgi:hypothetical protein
LALAHLPPGERTKMNDASKFLVRFENVGAHKRSWETTLKCIDFATLYREVKRRGGILSRGVDFCTDEEARTGTIFVGCFRRVGTFSWKEVAERSLQIQP